MFKDIITHEDIELLELQENLSFSSSEDNPKASRRELLKTVTSIDVQACPGSGKTTLIAAKLMLLAKKWPFKQQGICVLSHTNVAKNEIINCLRDSKIIESCKLLSYPHFIGTIQDFADKFLALPYLRSCGVSDFRIDSDFYTESAWRLLQERKKFSWLKGSLNGLGQEENQRKFLGSTFYFFEKQDLKINISSRPKAWKEGENSFQTAEKILENLKKDLISLGIFLYRDMYSFSEKILAENDELGLFIRKRFPIIFLDEMQDTQEFQDNLLQKIFPLNDESIIIQRFGDPDQAIFNGINGEKSNISYNSKSGMDYIINRSHRFDDSIATKIKIYSYNSVELKTELSKESLSERKILHSKNDNFKHTVFIYDTNTISGVISRFGQLVSSQFSSELKKREEFTVKAIGAVGKEIKNDGDLRIASYWYNFDNKKSKNLFKADSLIECVYYCRNLLDIDWNSSYRMINDYVLGILREAGFKDNKGRFFNASTLKERLKENDSWPRYRRFMYWALTSEGITDKNWQSVECFFEKFIIVSTLSEDIKKCLNFYPQAHAQINGKQSNLMRLDNNVLKYQNEFNIELSTIHKVKGETHDATLVLETKNKKHDIGQMLKWLTGADRKAPSVTEQKFMRQLYVAMSRPKYLLCLAVHKERVSASVERELLALDWNIEKL